MNLKNHSEKLKKKQSEIIYIPKSGQNDINTINNGSNVDII